MASWVRASILASVCLSLGCQDSPADHRRPESTPPPTRAFIPGASIPYVLDVLPDGSPIPGGARLLLIPSGGGREPLNLPNHPRRLHPALDGDAMRLDPALRRGEAGPGVFASSWWPQSQNGIADRWSSSNKDYEDLTSDPDNLAPTEKYDLLFFPGQRRTLPEVRSSPLADTPRPRRAPIVRPAITVAGPATHWEMLHHGLYQSVAPESWFGHCNGWASYTVAEPDGAPVRDVRVKLSGGAVVECAAGEAGCVLFRMADVEALMTELYFNSAATGAGLRCDTEPDQIQRDRYGRPTDPACRDLNPAALHVAMTRLLGVGATPLSPGAGDRPRPLPFIIDHALDWEVWSFPVTRFAVDEIEEVDAARAMALVCGGPRPPPRCREYQFNENATRFARVRARYWYLATGASRAELLRPAAQRPLPLMAQELRYVLEMSGDGTILGGEWLGPPPRAAGPDSKRVHPDFLFMPIRPQGAGEDEDDLGGTGDNPFISYSRVKSILRLASTPARGGGR